MSNNGWIKYSEHKPNESADYLIYSVKVMEILPYLTQDDIDCYLSMRKRLGSATNNDEYESIENEIYERFSGINIHACDDDGFNGEGFYACWYDESGFSHYEFVEPLYWQSLPELPTE